MNIVELAIIGSQKTEKEKLFSQLSDDVLRTFQGLNYGYLNLRDEKSIHFYFLNQEKEGFLYLWDLIITHALAVIVACDCEDPQILSENLAVIERLQNTYSTPYFICTFTKNDNLIAEMERLGIDTKDGTRILNFDPDDDQSAKNVLLEIFSILTNE